MGNTLGTYIPVLRPFGFDPEEDLLRPPSAKPQSSYAAEWVDLYKYVIDQMTEYAFVYTTSW